MFSNKQTNKQKTLLELLAATVKPTPPSAIGLLNVKGSLSIAFPRDSLIIGELVTNSGFEEFCEEVLLTAAEK